jgi:hypothetical protein
MFNNILIGKRFGVKGTCWYSIKSDYADGDDE